MSIAASVARPVVQALAKDLAEIGSGASSAFSIGDLSPQLWVLDSTDYLSTVDYWEIQELENLAENSKSVTTESPVFKGDGTVYASISGVDLRAVDVGKVRFGFQIASAGNAQNDVLAEFGEGSNRVRVFQNSGSGTLSVWLVNSGSTYAMNILSTNWADDADHVMEVCWGDGTENVTVDGVDVTVSTTGTAPTSIDFDDNEAIALLANTGAGGITQGSIWDFCIFDSDDVVQWEYSCQEGAGSTIYDAGANADHLTITGTPDWTTRSGKQKDRCILRGGRIGSNGEFIPAKVDETAAANGGALTGEWEALAKQSHGNPKSIINFDPDTDSDFTGRNIPTAYSPHDQFEATAQSGKISPANSASGVFGFGDSRLTVLSGGTTAVLNESFLGNVFVGLHMEAQSERGFYSIPGKIAYDTLLGCYGELDIPEHRGTHLTTTLGGNMVSQIGQGDRVGLGKSKIRFEEKAPDGTLFSAVIPFAQDYSWATFGNTRKGSSAIEYNVRQTPQQSSMILFRRSQNRNIDPFVEDDDGNIAKRGN